LTQYVFELTHSVWLAGWEVQLTTTPALHLVYSPLHLVVVPEGLVVGPQAGSDVHAVWELVLHSVHFAGLSVQMMVTDPEQSVDFPGAVVIIGALPRLTCRLPSGSTPAAA
jgi:hypothetical protein